MHTTCIHTACIHAHCMHARHARHICILHEMYGRIDGQTGRTGRTGRTGWTDRTDGLLTGGRTDERIVDGRTAGSRTEQLDGRMDARAAGGRTNRLDGLDGRRTESTDSESTDGLFTARKHARTHAARAPNPGAKLPGAACKQVCMVITCEP